MAGLDHLRAFAALLVVCYHGAFFLWTYPASVPGQAPATFNSENPFAVLVIQGHTAVGLFMVLSGFVFSVGAAGKDVLYLPFLRNRFLRIYPLLIAVALTSAAALPKQFTFVGFMQTLLFQGNLPGALAIQPFTGGFWAVSVEFQFYLAFPVLHRALERRGFRFGLQILVLASALRVMAHVLGANNALELQYYHLIGRIDELVLGMLTARVYLRLRSKSIRWGAATLATTGIALAAIYGFHRLNENPSLVAWNLGWPLVEGVIWSGVLLTYVSFAETLPALLSRLLSAVGRWSYSIYLLNAAAIYFMAHVVPFTPGANGFVSSQLYVLGLVLPLLLSVSALTYSVIERPFLELRGKYLTDSTRE